MHKKSKNKQESLAGAILRGLERFGEAYSRQILSDDVEFIDLLFFPYHRKIGRHRIRQELKRMQKRGLVSFAERGPKIKIELKPAGRDSLHKLKMKDLKLSRPDRWDQKWRLVVFDIPEDESKRRAAFRRALKRLGFIQVQQSVWTFPGDCRKEVAALSENFDVVKYVSLFEGTYLGDDRSLRQVFGL